MTFLLDVNVLIGLFDPDHLHHEASHRWLKSLGDRSWASCPLTENGLARILGNPNYPDTPGPPSLVLSRLAAFARSTNHVFWPDDFSLTESELLEPEIKYSAKQVTDVYLLALAKKHGGKLASFDRRIFAGAVVNGAESLHLISP